MTFGNLNGTERSPEGLVTIGDNVPTTSSEDTSNADDEEKLHKKVKCLIDKSIFEIPSGYKELGGDAFGRLERQGL